MPGHANSVKPAVQPTLLAKNVLRQILFASRIGFIDVILFSLLSIILAQSFFSLYVYLSWTHDIILRYEKDLHKVQLKSLPRGNHKEGIVGMVMVAGFESAPPGYETDKIVVIKLIPKFVENQENQ